MMSAKELYVNTNTKDLIESLDVGDIANIVRNISDIDFMDYVLERDYSFRERLYNILDEEFGDSE